ncbi:hypothetical protein KI387_001798, partial [Taxus chinensis]
HGPTRVSVHFDANEPCLQEVLQVIESYPQNPPSRSVNNPPLQNPKHVHVENNLVSSNRSIHFAPPRALPQHTPQVNSAPLLLERNKIAPSHESSHTSKLVRSSSVVPKVTCAVTRVKLEVEEETGVFTHTILPREPYEYVEMVTETGMPLLDLTGDD